MAQSTEFSDRPVSRSLAPERGGVLHRAVKAVGRFFHHSVFWTYQRGSWQYDIICAVILAFIFLTPASWFHDRPTLGLTNLRRAQGIIDVGHAKDGWHYIVDARLVDSLAPLAPTAAIHEILRERTGKPVKIRSIVTMYGEDKVILGYTVIFTR